ncbi:MAG: type II toxin-antitoxin system RelE/ParE family toxin [Acidobacteria bacterium]|nr:type II toxin-antitoxin system RelE/ParE family toxin [Acidobacteriota bacterium]
MPHHLRCHSIVRHHPYTGRTGIEEGTRELVIPNTPYVVVYRVIQSEAIQILRIWHGAQNR